MHIYQYLISEFDHISMIFQPQLHSIQHVQTPLSVLILPIFFPPPRKKIKKSQKNTHTKHKKNTGGSSQNDPSFSTQR